MYETFFFLLLLFIHHFQFKKTEKSHESISRECFINEKWRF